MYRNLTLNGVEYTSTNGELILDEYLPSGNPVNPLSSFGWFIYVVLGGGFDIMDEMITDFLNDTDVVSASSEKLNKMWGPSLNAPRPKIVDGGEERFLSDDEYRVYLYVIQCQLMTRLDLLSVFGHCMGDSTSEEPYNGVEVTKEDSGTWRTVDHLNYTSIETPKSNIGANDPTDPNRIINYENSEEDVNVIPGIHAYSGNEVYVVNVPKNNWSSAFLDFLVEYISIKGNVLIREK